ncbi:MAG: O-antigen ligase family protein [Actinomycetota bacterium]|nr:O-antigen ligase family protein [Actinomycetota bacterium]
MEARFLLGFGLASLLVFAATPVAIRVACHLEFFDKPAGYKGHARPTPYLGGAAVMAGFLLVAGALGGDVGRSAPVLGGAALLWALGTIDDRRHVSPGLRAGLEVALAAGVWALGHGWALGLGSAIDLAATCLWILAVVNAFNLFDNMDGASSTMALVVSGAVAILGIIEGDTWLVVTGAALSGACFGFLPHNLSRPNARIFLGDGGSMPIGFAVATLVMMGSGDALPEFQALLIGLLLVGIPALDTCLVIVSRRRKGISILTGGRDHLTHRTRRRVQSARAVAATLGGVQALVAALALVSANGSSEVLLLLVGVYVAAAGATITVLEAQEDRLHTAAVTSEEDPVLQRPTPLALRLIPFLALGFLGAGAATSPFFQGFYDARLWVPIGLGVITLAAAAAIGRPARLTRAGSVTLAGLAGLGIWALISQAWGESAEAAIVEGNRMLVLAAVLGLAIVLLRDERRSVFLVGVLGVGVLALAVAVLGRMLWGDTSLYLGGRLNEPLGYVNAEATVFAIGIWLSVTAAERRNPLLAGAGAGAATLCAGLTLMSQSRGAALAVIASTITVLMFVPGRQRRTFIVALVGSVVLLASGPFFDVVDTGVTGQLTEVTVRNAGLTLVVIGVVVGLVWAACVTVHSRATNDEPERSTQAAYIGGLVIGGAALLAVAVVIAYAGRVGDTVSTQYDAFVSVGEPTGSVVPAATTGSRLLSGSGTRYDYWRVAVDAWQDRPLLGLGAGNYDRAYFPQRRQNEDVRQPHSIELQTLSELGLVGGALLALFLGGVGFGAWRTGRDARTEGLTRTVAVAAVGGTTAWLVHTSVDWMHIVPGVTAIALCLTAVLVRRRDPGPVALTPRAQLALRGGGAFLAFGVAAIVVVAGASLARQGLGDHYRAEAFAALPDRPAEALRNADRSLRLDGQAVRSYYARAAALARFDEGALAEESLLEASRREPSDFVTWALLGDLAMRRGAADRAAGYYRQARTLNPLEPSISQAG